MKRFYFLALVVLVVLAGLATTLAQQAAPPQRPFVPVQDELLWEPDPADWLCWR